MKSGLAALLTIAVLVLTCLNISSAKAQVSDLTIANALYNAAESEYNNGSYAEALTTAQRAYTLYNKAGEVPGIQKTANLLDDIKQGLSKDAKSKYDQAWQYYTQGDYNRSESWASDANRSYSLILDAAGQAACENLIAQSREKFKEGLIREGNETYLAARTLYTDRKDLTNARAKAEEALNIYTEADYEPGMQKAQELITAIDKDINQGKTAVEIALKDAQDAFLEAQKAGDSEAYLKARNLAKKAKDMSSDAGDSESYKKAQEIIGLCDAEMNRIEKDMALLAEQKYNQGLESTISATASDDFQKKTEKYREAIDLFKSSETVYSNCLTWAKEFQDQNRITYYTGKISEAAQRRQEAEKSLRDVYSGQDAEKEMDQASRFYLDGECGNASIHGKAAETIYTNLKDNLGVSKTRDLLKKIGGCLGQLAQAQDHLNNATAFLKAANYKNAFSETDGAKEIYKQLNYESGLSRCDDMKSKIEASSLEKSKADGLVNQSLLHLAESDLDLDKAHTEANDARNIYLKLGFDAGVNRSDNILKEIEAKKNKIGIEAQWNRDIVMIVTVLGIGLVTVLWFVRQKEKEKKEREKADAERKKTEEEVRRRKEEERKSEDQRIKELEEERTRLKSMVADELSKIEAEKRKGSA